MRHRRAASVLAAVLALAPVAGRTAEPTSEKTAIVAHAIDDVLRPAYRDLSARAEEMAQAGAALCKAPSEEALATARARFAELVTSFSRIEFVRFGPIMEDNRIERFLFWPDRRGVALRQVQGLLAAKDEAATTSGGLRGKSVAVQGLNALEFLLHGTGAETLPTREGDYRCRYGAALAANLETSAAEIAAGWDEADGIAGALTRPSADNPAYREIDDSLDEILGTLVHGLEAIRDLRIQPGFGDTAEDANPKAWLFQRAGLTEESLAANVAGLSALYERSTFAALLPPAERAMDASIAADFADAGRAIKELGAPLATAAGDPNGRERIGRLLALVQGLQHLFADRFAPAVGLQAGFSSLDGD